MKTKLIIKVRFLILGLAFLFLSIYYLRLFILDIQKECSDQAMEIAIGQFNQSESIPSFVGNYWPAETENVTMACYLSSKDIFAVRRGVGINLETFDIAEYEVIANQNDNIEKPFVDRISLYIDGKVVSESSRVVIDNIVALSFIKEGEEYPTGMSSGYEISWTPLLLPGKHNAKITINTKSGQILEFDWEFTIMAF